MLRNRNIKSTIKTRKGKSNNTSDDDNPTKYASSRYIFVYTIIGTPDDESFFTIPICGDTGSTSARHTGQVFSLFNHSAIHTSQKMCLQSSVTGVLGLSKHTGQS